MTMTSDFYSDWIAAAEQYVPADVRVDMCRHTTVTEPTFWLLRGESQIAAITADNGKWQCIAGCPAVCVMLMVLAKHSPMRWRAEK